MNSRPRIRIPRGYTYRQIADLLDRASRLGYSLAANSPLEKLTIAELEQLVARDEATYFNDHPAPDDWPTCSFCGASVSPVTRKCESCGEKLPPRQAHPKI